MFEKSSLLMMLAGVLCLGGVGALGYLLLGAGGNAQRSGMRDLMGTQTGPTPARLRRTKDEDVDIEEIKRMSGSAVAKKQQTETVSHKLFKAGYYSAHDRKKFVTTQIVVFVMTIIFLPTLLHLWIGSSALTLVGFLLGGLIGYAMPISWLEREIRKREDDMLYFLPLVIEQVSIGVSSSLDIGPCLAHIVQTATERDSHNVITECFVHVEKLMRSGLNLEDSLIEVGNASGVTEVKHAFMFLAQCAKHGGELTKQLQDLADSVMTSRQTMVEGKIAALPVKATGPLMVVFGGFFIMLMSGLAVKLIDAFAQ